MVRPEEVKELKAIKEMVEPRQIIPAVRRALESGKPALLEMMVDSYPEGLEPPRSVKSDRTFKICERRK